MGEHRVALQTLSRALDSLPHQHATSEHLAAKALVGVIHMRGGDYAVAETCFRENLDEAGRLGQMSFYIMAIGHLGNCLHWQGRHLEELEFRREYVNRCRLTGDTHNLCFAVGNLGSVWMRLGEHDEAQTAFKEAIVLSREHGLTRTQAIYGASLGELQVMNGERDLRTLNEAVSTADASNDLYARVLTRCVLARCHHRSGDSRDAQEAFNQASGLIPQGHSGLSKTLSETKAFLSQ